MTGRIISIVFFAISFFGVSAAYAWAQEEADFSLSLRAEYVFSDQGGSSVTQYITLTNLKTNLYPSVYFLELPDDAASVVAFDTNGKLESVIVEEAGHRRVKIPLADSAVGELTSTRITVSYETQSLAQRIDNGWNIVIPPVSSYENITDYTASVTLPETWGKPNYIDPPFDTPYRWILTGNTSQPITISYKTMKTQKERVLEKPVSPASILAGIIIGGIIATSLYFFAKHRL